MFTSIFSKTYHSVRRVITNKINFKTNYNYKLTFTSKLLAAITIGLTTFKLYASSLHADQVAESGEMVSSHNSPSDAWIVINNNVYDITSLLNEHPGGAGILLEYVGKDVTHEFYALKHSKFAVEMLEALKIGKLKTSFPDKDTMNENRILPYNTTYTFVENELLYCRLPDTVHYIMREKYPFTLESTHTSKLIKERIDEQDKKSIVVIGAGICGSAVSYFLSYLGHDVTLIDKMPLVGGTALQSTAIMYIGPVVELKSPTTLNAWSGEVAFEMMKLIQNNWRNVDFISKPTLGVCPTDETVQFAMDNLKVGGQFYNYGDFVTPEKLLEIEPCLSPGLKGGVLLRKGATVDPFLVCQAYTERAIALGTKLELNKEVVNIERNGGKFRVICKESYKTTDKAVKIPDRYTYENERYIYDADHVIIATGWLCNKIAGMLGHDVKVRGVHGQLFTTKADIKLNTNLFSLEGPYTWRKNRVEAAATLKQDGDHYKRLARHFYAVQTSNGTLKIGGDRIFLDNNTIDLQRRVVDAGLEDTKRMATEIIPALANCAETGRWSGTMPFTPGQAPILGELEKGLWVMAGAPFTKGPAYAYLIAKNFDKDSEHEDLIKQVRPNKELL